MTEPRDPVPAAAGHVHLRVSQADREQVIGVLKAAFVQGMLAKEEFDVLVSQSFGSRTRAELVALTADLPSELTPAREPQPARAQGEPRIPRPGVVVTVATVVYAAVWPVAFLLPENSEGEPRLGLALVMLTGFCYCLLLLAAGIPILDGWLDKHW